VNGSSSLPHGLRHVLVYARLGGVFPPPPNSQEEIALLRAANRALYRKAMGLTDAFLFVFVGSGDASKEAAAIEAYGFPAATVASIEGQAGDVNAEQDLVELQQDAARLIAGWLAKEHAGAIAFPPHEYDATKFWWTGVEQADPVFDWPFSAPDVAPILPDTHSAKAETWLAVLGHAMELDAIQATSRAGLGQQRAALLAATLCEWLHGFEAASGNGWNHFEPYAAIQGLGISEFALGFEASRISGSGLEEFSDEHDEDVDGLTAAALSLITGALRSELRNVLSDFFGGDAALFWAIYSAIWPRFDQPMVEALNSLVNLEGREEFADLEAPWSFVVDGWHESADA